MERTIKRVYLSKSKAGDPDLLMKVRKRLKNYDIELVEYRGGEYINKLLLSSDIMLILPPVLPRPLIDKVNVGRGQWSEFNTCTTEEIPVFLITILSDSTDFISNITDWGVLEQDWTANYAELLFKDIRSVDTLLKVKTVDNVLVLKSATPMLALFPKYNN